MCLLTTVPPRLMQMAYDASESIVFTSHLFDDTQTIDDIKRPAAILDMSVGGGDYPPNAAGVEEPTETYSLLIVGENYGQGGEGQAELELRQIVQDVVNYFIRHTQLQVSNQRGALPAPLPPLPGVMWMRVQRAPATRMGSQEGSGRFWGCILTLTVTEAVDALEVIVPNVG